MKYIFAITMVFACYGALRAGGDHPTFEDVLKAFGEKEKQNEWIKLKCKCKCTIAKESELSLQKPQRLIPAEDVAFSETLALSLSADKWRFEHEGHSLDGQSGLLVRAGLTGVFNGGVLKTLTRDERRASPLGSINEGKYANIPQLEHMKAMFLIFRPLKSGILKPDEFKLTDSKAILRNTPTLMLQKEEANGRFWNVYIEDHLPFRVLRTNFVSNGIVGMTCDFSYEKERSYPTKWEVTRASTGTGKRLSHYVCVVNDATIGVPLSPNEFELNFPVGTKIQDSRKNEGM